MISNKGAPVGPGEWAPWIPCLLLFLGACAGEETPPPDVSSLVVTDSVHVLAGVAIREPMVVEHPEGALFVAGFSQDMAETGQPPKLFRSPDGGRTWERVNVGTPEQGAVGNSDVDLAIGPQGTLYFLTMAFDRRAAEGTHVAVGVSRDAGESWRWTYLSRDRFVDRPWIGVTPDGVAHVIWNDGNGLSHALSTDLGATWSHQPKIHPQGGSSHLAVGPNGEMAVRISPLSASGLRYDEGVDLLAVSEDGGSTWRKISAPGERDWGSGFQGPEVLPRWVEPLAWDADGTLFHLWSEGSSLWLGRSSDGGESWETWPVASGETPVFFPYLTAAEPGRLAASWFSGVADRLWAHVAVLDASNGPPSIRSLEPFSIDCWIQDEDSLRRDTCGEYFPVLFLSHGDLGVVTSIQNPLEGRLGFSWRRVSY